MNVSNVTDEGHLLHSYLFSKNKIKRVTNILLLQLVNFVFQLNDFAPEHLEALWPA